MTPKSEAQKVERKYPTLFTTVLAAVLARNRDLSSQVASLSAEQVQMQDNAAARDQDLDDLRERNRDLNSQVTSLSTGKVRMQEAMAEQDVRMQALEQEKEALIDEKNQNAFANLGQQLTERPEHNLAMDGMLQHSAALVRRTLHAENTLQSERGLHEATEAAYRMVLDENKTKTRKRGREAEDSPHRRSKKVKHANPCCIECYKSKIHKQCDGASPCWPCKHLGKVCKRMRCKYYNNGTCRIANCTLAHSDSGFPEGSLSPFQHVAQSSEPAPFVPPKPTTN
ncbi:uncharacterized protein J4E84_010291 [Alternaria hordeiaustralica]|uniref:uncharacterized protein n=1 Tax=Alternaria hordeiaustralica TaxID=1187925 RepID=UPI0020C42D9A|nr:uncharacterized protein J4E84_010291 [Alternaria hordeiaustralica]KAI4674850.1 hypothetical protein J4E84_010291 [Alternaria hordeiaustralica]